MDERKGIGWFMLAEVTRGTRQADIRTELTYWGDTGRHAVGRHSIRPPKNSLRCPSCVVRAHAGAQTDEYCVGPRFLDLVAGHGCCDTRALGDQTASGHRPESGRRTECSAVRRPKYSLAVARLRRAVDKHGRGDLSQGGDHVLSSENKRWR